MYSCNKSFERWGNLERIYQWIFLKIKNCYFRIILMILYVGISQVNISITLVYLLFIIYNTRYDIM